MGHKKWQCLWLHSVGIFWILKVPPQKPLLRLDPPACPVIWPACTPTMRTPGDSSSSVAKATKRCHQRPASSSSAPSSPSANLLLPRGGRGLAFVMFSHDPRFFRCRFAGICRGPTSPFWSSINLLETLHFPCAIYFVSSRRARDNSWGAYNSTSYFGLNNRKQDTSRCTRAKFCPTREIMNDKNLGKIDAENWKHSTEWNTSCLT